MMFRSFVKNSVKIVDLTASSKIAKKGFATYKTSTGLTGLKVDPNGRENLLVLTDEILNNVKVDSTLSLKLSGSNFSFISENT